MKWKKHYTGIEIANLRGDGSGLYMSRDTDTKRLRFIRYSRGKRFHVHAFIGSMNALRMRDNNHGVEIGTLHARIGITCPPSRAPLYRVLNPNIKPPVRRFVAFERDRESIALRVGWFAIGFDLPKRIKRALDEHAIRREQRMWEAFEREHPEECCSPCNPNFD